MTTPRNIDRKATKGIVRLWWRCGLCNLRFDTFGKSHDDEDDRRAVGFEIIGHLEAEHGLEIERIPDAVAVIRPDGATTRVVKHHVLVEL